MNGFNLLVLTAVYLAAVGLSQPLKSAKAKAEAPHEDAPEAKKTEEAPADEGDKAATTPPEAKDQGNGGHNADSKIDEAITVMNNLNDLFEKIVHAIQEPKAGGAPPEAAPVEETAPSEDSTDAAAPTTEGPKTTAAAATDAAGTTEPAKAEEKKDAKKP